MKDMQAVILAGGLGTRLAEETDRIPKPMVTIGSQPILWHVMKIYSSFGVKDFVICGGYRIGAINEYFVNYRQHTSNLRIDIARNEVSYLDESPEDWRVTIIDTGAETMTGGRLKRVREYLAPDRPFFMTYGDGVADVDLGRLLAHHREMRCEATLTAVRPPARFGATLIENGRVTRFSEKPISGEGHINGGFFVLNPSVLDLVAGDATVWEQEPLEMLAARGQLGAYVHDGFWHPMDTLRDRRQLEQLWESGAAPWKKW